MISKEGNQQLYAQFKVEQEESSEVEPVLDNGWLMVDPFDKSLLERRQNGVLANKDIKYDSGVPGLINSVVAELAEDAEIDQTELAAALNQALTEAFASNGEQALKSLYDEMVQFQTERAAVPFFKRIAILLKKRPLFAKIPSLFPDAVEDEDKLALLVKYGKAPLVENEDPDLVMSAHDYAQKIVNHRVSVLNEWKTLKNEGNDSK